MDIEILVGKTLISVVRLKIADYTDKLVFSCTDGTSYEMYHSQDCCESVELEDVTGDFEDLIGTPIVKAAERSNERVTRVPTGEDQQEWTFYRISTIKGTVTLRWYGTSNGYYSTSVSFVEVVKEEREKRDEAAKLLKWANRGLK